MNRIIQRFNSIPWHDSKLLGFAVFRAESGDQVKLSLLLHREDGLLEPAEIIFKESTYIELEVDLEGKRVCADDIADGECLDSSELLKSLSEQNPYDSFQGYLHFQIELIPPGGEIDILAKDFTLLSVVSESATHRS